MIECYFDCSSPWTYMGFHNLRSLAAELDAPVRWRPILVGGVFNSVNPSVYERRANPVPAKDAYMRKDMADWARRAGLDIRFPPTVFPVNSVKAMRGCIWLEPQGLLEPFADAVFRAYWSRDEDVSQDAVLRPLVESLGVEWPAFVQGIASATTKDALRANTDELIARGGFGSPTFFVDGEMFFGNDRLVLVRDRVEARR